MSLSLLVRLALTLLVAGLPAAGIRPAHGASIGITGEVVTENAQLRRALALTEAGEAAFYSGEGEEPVVAYGQALLPRGPGFFALAGTFGGEVSAVNPRFAPIMEFEFDAEGRAVAFTLRSANERIMGTGVRAGR